MQSSSENKLGAKASKSTGGSFAARRKTEKSAPYRATTIQSGPSTFRHKRHSVASSRGHFTGPATLAVCHSGGGRYPNDRDNNILSARPASNPRRYKKVAAAKASLTTPLKLRTHDREGSYSMPT